MYINKAMLYGNLTRDPEMRALPSGGNVCSFSIATNRVYKKADGSRAEEVSYHNVVVFGRTAEIEGRLQTRSWDKDGQKQYRTEVVADRVQFGPRPTGGSAGGAAYSAPATPEYDASEPMDAPQQRAPKDDAIDYPAEDINPDDIPF
jgi:single-strand DNA-binding protein